jgi:hypothetical protein
VSFAGLAIGLPFRKDHQTAARSKGLPFSDRSKSPPVITTIRPEWQPAFLAQQAGDYTWV